MEFEQRIHRGVMAAEVIQNEVYQEGYEILKQEILTKWQDSPARDVEGREKLYLMLGILEKVRSLMESAMLDGKIASKDLEYRQSLVERAKEAVSAYL